LFPCDFDNSAFNAFDVDAADTSTVKGSNLQQKFHSNACTDDCCSNTGDNFNEIKAAGDCELTTDNDQSNTCEEGFAIIQEVILKIHLQGMKQK
jgi:hypothetical protein